MLDHLVGGGKGMPASLQWAVAEPAAMYRARVSGSLPILLPRPRLIDLFSGAGGMTAGFSHFFGHSFEPVWANDMNYDAAETYNSNFGNHCVVGDIVALLQESEMIPPAEVVIGGPPCQGFSLLNKGRDVDPRKEL